MRYKKLIFVDETNKNKFYTMEQTSDTEFKVTYGRVGNSGVVERKSMSQWDSVYKSKIKKGYKDVTELQSETAISNDYISESNPSVNSFVNKMKAYMNNSVTTTYKAASTTTMRQVEECQIVLNKLRNYIDDTTTNQQLIELYTIIPRNMRKVTDWLLPNVKLNELIDREQDNIDAVKSYLGQFTQVTGETTSYLQSINVDLKPCEDTSPIKYIIDQLRAVKAIYKAKRANDKPLEDKAKRYLIHGTRNMSVLPILEQGLKIRPTGNFTFSGKAYGNGVYFSEVASKSMGYTGNDIDKVLLIYEVVVGNPFIYEGWFRGNSFELNEAELKKRGFDSTYVKAGNGLLNSEIIVYTEDKFNLRYIIHL